MTAMKSLEDLFIHHLKDIYYAEKQIVKALRNELRDFRLGGAELPDDKKKRYLEVQERLADLSSRFSDNLL